jgi:hypothetical protein
MVDRTLAARDRQRAFELFALKRLTLAVGLDHR